MGELLPYCVTRLNLALTFGNWLVADQERKVGGSSGRTMQKSVRYYLRQNVFVTSSGVFDQPVLDCAVAMLGIDHLLFSVDYPFQDNVVSTDFLRKAALSSQEREQFAHGNAERLLELGRNRGRPVRAWRRVVRVRGEDQVGRPCSDLTAGQVAGHDRPLRSLAQTGTAAMPWCLLTRRVNGVGQFHDA